MWRSTVVREQLAAVLDRGADEALVAVRRDVRADLPAERLHRPEVAREVGLALQEAVEHVPGERELREPVVDVGCRGRGVGVVDEVVLVEEHERGDERPRAGSGDDVEVGEALVAEGKDGADGEGSFHPAAGDGEGAFEGHDVAGSDRTDRIQLQTLPARRRNAYRVSWRYLIRFGMSAADPSRACRSSSYSE